MALVLGTDDHNLAVSLYYLAFIAHRLYRRSNFHFLYLRIILIFNLASALTSPRNASFGKVIRAHFELYVIALYNSDIVEAKLTRNVRRDYVTVCELNFEIRVGQAFDNLALSLDNVVL